MPNRVVESTGRLCRRALVLAGILVMSAAATASAQVFRDADIRQVIRSVESATDYRFLYRDALIAGKTLSVSLDDNPISAVSLALQGLGLGVQVDDERAQVLIFRLAGASSEKRDYRISGHVLDGSTGGRLPFATVSWIDNDGHLRGVACNDAGYFETRLRAGASNRLTFSYLGYDATSVQVDVEDRPVQIDVRLRPKPLMAREVVVSGTVLHTDLDTTWHHLIRPGLQAPLGEASVLRSLESLPSVSISTALSDGITVRGSRADGFQVLLDGLPIYSRSHMFGLFDAFNEDALQTVGFYYGIAPASYQAPPGGTVSFHTRTGSQEHPGGSLAVSNTSIRGTAEGPLGRGRGSWLLSGRLSYLGQLDWFGNDALVAQGLDVGRQTSLDLPGGRPFEVLNGEADYHDIHAKLFFESASGGRFTLSGYTGGDKTSQSAERRLRIGNTNIGQSASANSNWGTGSVSVRYQQPTRRLGYLTVLGGATRYDASYLNNSIVVRARRNDPDPQPRLATFENDNELIQFRFAPELSWGTAGVWSAGVDFNYYDALYNEKTGDRPLYQLLVRSAQTDLFVGYASGGQGVLDYEVGLRSHYYSVGEHFRLSPRGEVRVGDGPVSVSLGASRNHQFLHQLEVQPVQESAPNVWILSSSDESPGSVDYLTAGVYFRPTSQVFVQFEAYLKNYSDLRLHETANPDPRLENEIDNPWLTNTDGEARGLEAMLRHRLGPFVWSHAYTLSRTTYTNPRVLTGREFFVSWDRRHQYVSTAELRMGRMAAHASWSIASGTPNALGLDNNAEADRLPTYHRLDLGFSYEYEVGPRSIRAGFSIYNALDRQNVWYRTAVPLAIVGPPGNRALDTLVPADVFDLGAHPSFELGVRF